MPGTDFTITDNKIRLAVSSSGPQIKLESPEENRVVTTFEMTPTTTSQESVNLTQNAPSSVESEREMLSNGYVSPVDKMTDREAIVDTLPENTSQIPADGLAMTKTTKSASCGSLSTSSPALAHQSNRCRRVSAGAVDFAKVKTEYCTRKDENEMNNDKKEDKLSQNQTSESVDTSLRGVSDKITQDNEKLKENNKNEQTRRRPQFQRHHSTTDVYVPMIALERKYECDKCGVSFRSRDTFEVHSKHYCSGKRRVVECHLCEAKFDDEKRLQVHMEVHSLQYICLICSQRMPTPAACQSHMQLHAENLKPEVSKDGSVQCPACDITLHQKSDLVLHLCSQHVTVGNMPQFLYPPMIPPSMEKLSSSPRPLSKDSREKSNNGFPRPRDNQKTPPRDKIDDVDLHNISPPVITSTPTRPSGDAILNSVPNMTSNAFSCIVCGLGFPDVITLQRHLLTTHTTAAPQKVSSPLAPPPPPSNPPQKQRSKMNCRKVSTVSAPQLSLLSGLAPSGISKSAQMESSKIPGSPLQAPHRYSPDSVEEVRNKKRKESSDNEDIENSEQFHQGLKRAKRDVGLFNDKVDTRLKIPKDTFENRRVSCPVVTNKMLTEQLRLSEAMCAGTQEEEHNCIQCDIRFSSAANYRAHKKYYCASRHMHKIGDDGQAEFFGRQPDDLVESSDFLSVKSRRRNVGNRSSVTSRKRSHLTPLETVRTPPPCQEPSTSTAKLSSARKSHLEPADANISKSPSPNRETSPIPAPQMTKKHLCQECNIWFSKYDTYMAHKKYYCESRRKDRVSVRSLHATTKMPLKRKSESNLRESIARSGNSIFIPEHISWSPQRSTPSTDAEDDRSTGPIQSDSSSKAERKISSVSENSMPFPMYGQMDPEMLARISFMQPLILNQYLAMLRERMAQGIQNTGLLFPTLPLANLPGSRSLTPTEHASKTNDGRISAEEVRRSSVSPSTSGTKLLSSAANMRPARQSCVAAINVKKEPNDTTRLSPENRVTPRLRTSPLDLSNKLDVQLQDSTSASLPPYPTIDLRTTALAFVKQEPNSDFPSNKSPIPAGENSDSGNNSNNTSKAKPEIRISDADAPVSVPSQEKEDGQNIPQKSRAQHCKNCDARFTSLSTFIAHKKYYCSGTNNSGLIRNDAKAAQMAH